MIHQRLSCLFMLVTVMAACKPALTPAAYVTTPSPAPQATIPAAGGGEPSVSATPHEIVENGFDPPHDGGLHIDRLAWDSYG